jgi:16S rRNA processing protein RimM
MTSVPELVRVAHIRREHGTSGALLVQPLGGDARRFSKSLEVVLEGAGTRHVVKSAAPTGTGDVILSLDTVATREEAARLRGAYLCVPPDQLRPLGENEWFVWQMQGLRVVDKDDNELGHVIDVEEQPAQNLLVVATPDGEQRFPMVSAFVDKVDLERGVVVVTPWPWDED